MEGVYETSHTGRDASDPMIGDWQNVTFDSITLDEAENSMLKFHSSRRYPFRENSP
jgi:hypothetical protein